MTNQDLEKFDWTSSNASDLREFFSSETGVKVLRALALEEPELLRKGDTNEILIRSGETAQHKYLTSFLLSLTGDNFELNEDVTVSDAYPDPTDDSKWDGPKIDEQP
jgi:hypothetical protein